MVKQVRTIRPLAINHDLRRALEASSESSMATWHLGWHMMVMINYLHNHCQADPVLIAVCNHLHGAIQESHQTSAQAASGAIAAECRMILDASAFQDCRPLRATLLSTPLVGSSIFDGGYREQTPRGAPWVSGLVGHFVQTWPDSECSHTVQFLDSAVLRL